MKGDLISRSALLEDIEATVRFSVRGYDAASGAARGARMVLDRIHAAPAVDAVPVVHGRWNIILDDYGCELMRCSCCKEEFYDGDNDTVDVMHNFCPNCGAKMDGGEKDATD